MKLVHLEGEERGAAVAALARELEELNVDEGLYSIAELCAPERAEVFSVECGGRVVAHYALATKRHAQATEGLILAAAGAAPGVDLTRRVVPFIERQFLELDALTVYTKRLGLAKKLALQGYAIEGYVVRKRFPRGGRC